MFCSFPFSSQPQPLYYDSSAFPPLVPVLLAVNYFYFCSLLQVFRWCRLETEIGHSGKRGNQSSVSAHAALALALRFNKRCLKHFLTTKNDDRYSPVLLSRSRLEPPLLGWSWSRFFCWLEPAPPFLRRLRLHLFGKQKRKALVL